MTKEEILQRSNGGLEIFKHLIPDLPAEPKKGKKFKAVFRNEKTASANLIEKDGVWLYKDLGDSESALNAIDFIMKLRNVEFVEALKLAADWANLPPAELKPSPVIPTIRPTEKQLENVLRVTNTPLHTYCRNLGIPDSHLAGWLMGGMVNKHGWLMTSFVYADQEGYHNIKSVWYNEETGKRVREAVYPNKDGEPEKQAVFPISLTKTGYRYGFCLFGAHRVNVMDSQRPLVVVESEKTAIIGSWFYPELDFVASHGLNGGNLQQFLALMQPNPDKPVLVLCDADYPRKTPLIFKDLEAARWNVHLLDLYPERTDKSDLADYIHERLKPVIKAPGTRQIVDKETGDSYYLSTKPDWNVVANIESKQAYKTPREKRQEWRKQLEAEAQRPQKDEDGNIIQKRESLPSDYIQDEAFTDDYDPLTMFWKTGVYMYNNCFWVIHNNRPKAISNFVFRIKQQIKSQGRTIRLVEMKNQYGDVVMAEMPTKDMVTLISFQIFCLDQGYFEFQGNAAQLAALRSYTGEMAERAVTIESLGWQRKYGFFAFCNGVIHNGHFQPCSENGLVSIDDYSYFIPYGNETNEGLDIMYTGERKVKFMASGTVFNAWAGMHYEVHGEPGMIGQLFAVMTLFSDLICKVQGGFPVLMLYGEGSSGKGALSKSIQILFGEVHDAIPLNTGASTIKGKIRSLAQFVNLPIILEEYVRDDENDELLKSIWDRTGYRVGTISRKNGTETIPVLCTAIVTSNQYPVEQPLIQRLIILEMHNIDRTSEQMENYNILSKMEAGNLSQLSLEILSLRSRFEERFEAEYQRIQQELIQNWPKLGGARMYSNAASFLATMVICSEVFKFPYVYRDVEKFLQETISVQVQKMSSGGQATCFFEAIGYAISRGEIQEYVHFSVDGSILTMNISRVMTYYMMYCKLVTNTSPLARHTLGDKLRSYKAYLGSFDTARIGGERTSAMKFNMELIETEIEAIINSKRIKKDL